MATAILFRKRQIFDALMSGLLKRVMPKSVMYCTDSTARENLLYLQQSVKLWSPRYLALLNLNCAQGILVQWMNLFFSEPRIWAILLLFHGWFFDTCKYFSFWNWNNPGLVTSVSCSWHLLGGRTELPRQIQKASVPINWADGSYKTLLLHRGGWSQWQLCAFHLQRLGFVTQQWPPRSHASHGPHRLCSG